MTSHGHDGLCSAERCIVAVALALSLAPVLPSARTYGPGLAPDSQPIFQVAWITIYAFGLVIALRHRVPLWRRIRANAVVVAPLVLAVASVCWSDASSLTLRRSVALLLTTVFALTVAEVESLEGLFELLSWVLGTLLVASLVVAVAVPGYGVDHLRGGAWQGVFATKNELGRISALAIAVWTLQLLARPRKTLLLCMLPLALLLLFESHSRTSWIVAGVCVCFVSLVPMLRGDPLTAVAGSMFGIAIFGAAAFWLFTHQEVVLSTLNASPSLTGRTQIWDAAWFMIQKHLWLGYGYAGFWLGADGPSGMLWNIVGSTPPHAHNGVLDVWLDLGAVGVCLVICSFVVLVRRAWLLLRTPGSALNSWPVLFCLFLVMSNLTESMLLVENSLFWLLTVALAAQAASGRRRALSVRTAVVARPRLAMGQ